MGWEDAYRQEYRSRMALFNTKTKPGVFAKLDDLGITTPCPIHYSDDGVPGCRLGDTPQKIDGADRETIEDAGLEFINLFRETLEHQNGGSGTVYLKPKSKTISLTYYDGHTVHEVYEHQRGGGMQ